MVILRAVAEYAEEKKKLERNLDMKKKFYKGCAVCRESFCPERCFECAEPEITKEDWIHTLGLYFARFKKEHKTSAWSQAILKAKKHFMPIVSSFGKIVAHYMDAELADMKPYLITNVPIDYSEPYFKTSATHLLAYSAYINLKNRKWIDVKQLLIQTRMKAKKQHVCKNDTQRKRNIQGVYAVQNADMVEGKNIILLDDVVTSGATMKECAKRLFEAGARTVIGLALAKTVRMTPLVSLLN